MRIPSDAIIAEQKLTDYLLVRRPWDDKSGYLGRAGFDSATWTELREAIRRLADTVEAVEDGFSEYGTFYRVEGTLTGPTGTVRVVCVWMKRAVDGSVHFVTLKPFRRRSDDVSPAL
jgi:hypothetical protein